MTQRSGEKTTHRVLVEHDTWQWLMQRKLDTRARSVDAVIRELRRIAGEQDPAKNPRVSPITPGEIGQNSNR